MQRIAVGAQAQPAGRGHRQAVDAHRARQLPQVVLVQAVEPDGHPQVPGGQAGQAVREGHGVVGPHGEDGQHAVGDQPAKREHDRLQGRPVGPVGVVHREHDDCPGQRVQELQPARAHPDRVDQPITVRHRLGVEKTPGGRDVG